MDFLNNAMDHAQVSFIPKIRLSCSCSNVPVRRYVFTV
jgi:hypothetical protein